MKSPTSPTALREEPDCPLRPRISECLSDRTPRLFTLEKSRARTKLIGKAYAIDGKTYILNQDELVYDATTQEAVFDSRIYDKVFDRYEEDLILASAIRRKTRDLSRRNPTQDFGKIE